jgi:hypothetical protein
MPSHPIPIFRGRIEGGKIQLERQEDFAALIARLDGKEIDLRLSKHRNVRSISANAYYWAVVIPLLGELGEAAHRAQYDGPGYGGVRRVYRAMPATGGRVGCCDP